MDFSDLPEFLSDLSEAARDRIRVAEPEAEEILKRGKVLSKVVRIRAKIPWAKRDHLLEAGAQDSVRQGRKWAAGYLLVAVAFEYLDEDKLSIDEFSAKLDTIGGWVCKKFRANRAWLTGMKRHWRVQALRKRAAALESDETKVPVHHSETSTGRQVPGDTAATVGARERRSFGKSLFSQS
jgi:hypothetical protein